MMPTAELGTPLIAAVLLVVGGSVSQSRQFHASFQSGDKYRASARDASSPRRRPPPCRIDTANDAGQL